MNIDFPYGNGRLLKLSVADEALVASCGRPQDLPIEDLAAAVRAALSQPLDYPPLARATTPEDRVVLAVDDGVPRCAEIVAATIGYLVQSGILPDGITVLRTASAAGNGGPDIRSQWPEQWHDQVDLLTHDPDNSAQLAYLAMSHDGDAVLLNRALFDADLVLPIGVLRPEGAPGDFGCFGGIYPTFADQKALQRFRDPGALRAHGKRHAKLRRQAEEAAWLLGVTFSIQVVPGDGDHVLGVLAGEPASIGRQGRTVYDRAWKSTVPGRASLVVAAIGGGVEQQNWLNLGRVLAAASALVEDGGAVAVCCDLAASPGPGVQSLSEVESPVDAIPVLRRARPADLLTAVQLVQALEQCRLYLLSGLDESLVEQLNMVPIDGVEDLARLVQRHPSCIVLANAQRVAAHLEEEP